MLRALAYIAWGGIFFVLTIFALSLVLDFDSLKPQAEKMATEALGVPVTARGHVRLGLIGWRPALAFHDVSAEGGLSAAQVDLTLLKANVAAGFMIHLTDVRLSGRPVGDYNIPLQFVPGGFKIDLLEGAFGPAELAGDVSYVGDDFRANAVVRNLPLKALLEEASGAADGKLSFSGKGLSLDKVLRTLDGRFLLTSGEGRLTSKSLNFWSRGLMQILLPMQRTETNLNCAVLDFDVKGGIARGHALIVDTSEISIFGKGAVDLSRGTVDMLLTPKPKDMTLVSLATPARLKGPVDNVTVTPEAGGMVKKVGGLLLGVMNPTMLLIPLLEEAGSKDYSASCMTVLKEQAQKK